MAMSAADASDRTTTGEGGFLSTLATRPIWQVGALAGVAAAVATTIVALIAKAVDVPLEARSMGQDSAEDIALYFFPINTLFWTLIGTVIAVIMARRAKDPARTFVITTIVLTVLSLGSPAMAQDATTATKVSLAMAHIVAAAIVIPALAWRLSQPDMPVVATAEDSDGG
jgi:amino acid transporter